MTDNKFCGMLGLARRAGEITLGHDAAIAALQNRTAYLCLLASDASERLCAEFERATQRTGHTGVPLYKTDLTMNEIGQNLGAKKTAVLTVDDRGFADRMIELIGRE